MLYYGSQDWNAYVGGDFYFWWASPDCNALSGTSRGFAIFRDVTDPDYQLWASTRLYGNRLVSWSWVWGVCTDTYPCPTADSAEVFVNRNNLDMVYNTDRRHMMAVHELGHVITLGHVVQAQCGSPLRSVMVATANCLVEMNMHSPQQHDIDDVRAKY